MDSAIAVLVLCLGSQGGLSCSTSFVGKQRHSHSTRETWLAICSRKGCRALGRGIVFEQVARTQVVGCFSLFLGWHARAAWKEDTWEQAALVDLPAAAPVFAQCCSGSGQGSSRQHCPYFQPPLTVRGLAGLCCVLILCQERCWGRVALYHFWKSSCLRAPCTGTVHCPRINFHPLNSSAVLVFASVGILLPTVS